MFVIMSNEKQFSALEGKSTRFNYIFGPENIRSYEIVSHKRYAFGSRRQAISDEPQVKSIGFDTTEDGASKVRKTGHTLEREKKEPSTIFGELAKNSR